MIQKCGCSLIPGAESVYTCHGFWDGQAETRVLHSCRICGSAWLAIIEEDAESSRMREWELVVPAEAMIGLKSMCQQHQGSNSPYISFSFSPSDWIQHAIRMREKVPTPVTKQPVILVIFGVILIGVFVWWMSS